ncbi:MAG: Uma2 family endonuclease [bacterium]
MTSAIVPTLKKIIFNYEDYRQTPDDGKRYELIDGELYASGVPPSAHQLVVGNLLMVLTNYLKRYDIGKVLMGPLEVFFSETNLAQPDVIFISNDNLKIIKPTKIKGAPDLVIEVLSPGTEKRDRTIKAKMYAKFGVQEYWLVKEKTATVEILCLQKGKLVPVVRLGKSDILTSPLFPDLKIPLSEIFDI